MHHFCCNDYLLLKIAHCPTGMFVTWFVAAVVNTTYTGGKSESSLNVCESFTEIYLMEEASYFGANFNPVACVI